MKGDSNHRTNPLETTVDRIYSDENCTLNKISYVFHNLLMFIDIKFCKFMPGFLVSHKSGGRKGEKE
jgi:hypothetical protein